jgi:3''-phosphoadenosine 5''-phosphosulfate sulfotransferase (PAPS reductase)/FAD synthetase and related enzymes
MDYNLKKMAARAEILKAYTAGDQPWLVTYSGGKDSSVMLSEVIRTLVMLRDHNPAQLKRKIIITTSQTHLDLVTDPLKQEEMQKIREYVNRYQLPVEIREVEAPTEKTFMYLVVGKGYPLPKSRVNRWCTERLKIEPSNKLKKELEPELTAIGVRLSETIERRASIESRQVSEYYSDNAFMPIVNFTLDDVWTYLIKEGMPWGSAEKLSQLYKDATGECGLHKKAGRNEKTDDPCGARTGCIICPVVTIDKSSKEFAKTHPWLQPYVELRNIIIDMYKDERNKSGTMRNGTQLGYGKGTFTIKARMKLYEIIKQAEADNEKLALMYGAQPQKLIYSDELDELIHRQWEEDALECPWLEDAQEIGRFYEVKIKGLRNGSQLVWNYLYDTPLEAL